MKKLLYYTLSLIFLSYISFGQQLKVGWSTAETFSDFKPTNDGGVLGWNTLDGSFKTQKYSSSGSLIFTQFFKPKLLQLLPDGSFIFGVNENSTQMGLSSNLGGYDVWIVKVTANGSIAWQKSLSGSGNDYLEDLQITSMGEIVVLTRSSSTDGYGTGNKGGVDLWLTHLSSSGTLTKLNLGGSQNETFKNLVLLSPTEYMVCLTTNSQDGIFNQGFKGNIDTWLLKVTKELNFNITQKRAYGGSADDEANLIAGNQKYLLAGYSKSTNGDLSSNQGQKDIWLSFINSDGTLINSTNYGGTNDDFVKDAYFNAIDNSFYIFAENQSFDGNFPNAANHSIEGKILKFSHLGSYLWRRDFYISGGLTCGIRTLLNSSGVIIYGALLNGSTTDLFSYTSNTTTSFFCLLNATNGNTSWVKTPAYSTRFNNSMSLLGSLYDGNFLCSSANNYSTGSDASLFSINPSSGNHVKTYLTRSCNPPFPTSCSFAPYKATISTDDVIYYQQGNSFNTPNNIYKVCPHEYTGITKQLKYFCNEVILDTLRVPDDNEFNFQWKKNGVAISGATTPTYIARDLGRYSVEISGKTCLGKAETDSIVLKLATVQTILPQLKNSTTRITCIGDTITLTLEGGCNYGFLQWQKNGVDITEQTSLTLRVHEIGTYRVKVTTNGNIAYTNSIDFAPSCCTMMSINNGAWESPSTWSCNRIPNAQDEVWIKGHSISVSNDNARAKTIHNQGGVIRLLNNGKVTLSSE